jgi:hypothetical protein
VKKFDRHATDPGGSINGFSSCIIRFPAERVTVIVLSSRDRTSATKAANNLAAIVFGAPHKLPKPHISDVLSATIAPKGIDAGERQFRDLNRTQTDNYNFNELESALNDSGYDLLGSRNGLLLYPQIVIMPPTLRSAFNYPHLK